MSPPLRDAADEPQTPRARRRTRTIAASPLLAGRSLAPVWPVTKALWVTSGSLPRVAALTSQTRTWLSVPSRLGPSAAKKRETAPHQVARSGARMKIIVFPAYTNPYQSLLYGAMAALRPDLEVSYSRYHRTLGSLPLLTSMPWKRLRGYHLLHIHWPSFGLSRNGPLSRPIASLILPITIYLAKLLGFRLVWTVHNVLPHEPQTLDDVKAARFLSRNVDAKIVLSHSTISDMRCHGLDVNHVSVIPHGNYLGVYPDVVTRSAARERLAVREDEVLVLFFGRIRPYKGVSDLLGAFDRLNSPAAKLLLAGRVFDLALQREIHRAIQKSNVIAHEGHVNDEDVATYFRASDVVCLPFRAITNSGSALLALSFARPIIAPRSGSLSALPSSVGYLYDPLSPGALDRSLADAISDHGGRAERGRAARAYAATLRWDSIAADTLSLYAHLLSSTVG